MWINILILIIYIWALLVINIPNLRSHQHLPIKIYLFAGVLLFQFIVGILIPCCQSQIVNFKQVSEQSIKTALITVVAYSISVDVHQNQNNLSTILIISVCLAVFYFWDSIINYINPKANDAINIIYNKYC